MKKEVLLLVGVALIIFGVLFYWYGYRPSKIKQECARISTQIDSKDSKLEPQKQEYMYDICIKARGL